MLLYCVHIDLNYLHFTYLWKYWCKIGGRNQQTISKHLAWTPLFRIKNATDKKCKRQEKTARELACFLLSREQYRKNDRKNGHRQPSGFYLFFYISSKINLDALYWHLEVTAIFCT